MMKFSVAILLSVVCLLVLIGCNNPDADSSMAEQARENTGKVAYLPDMVVGMWKAQKSPWLIELGPEGVVSAVIPLGEAAVRPNQVTEVEMKDGGISTYKAGDCYAEYNPLSRELFVSIEIEEIHIRFMDEVLDGNSVDRFVGTVSKDGKTWMPDNITIFDYGPRFPQDENDIYPEPMVFEKVVQEGQQE